MEIQNILIFVLVGAVCMVIVTGGALSMSSDETPSPTTLAGGAAVGGAIGAALSALNSNSLTTSMSNMVSVLGADGPEMKVGLPSF
jgi:NADH:ubiquinone oxidoreductase subunit 6 (subunit J)